MDLQTKAVDLLNKLESLTTQYTPEVVNEAINVVRITAVGNLIWGVIGLAGPFFIWLYSVKLIRFFTKKHKENPFELWEAGQISTIVIAGAIVVVTTLCGIEKLFNIWNWVAIVNPELALAHKVLGL